MDVKIVEFLFICVVMLMYLGYLDKVNVSVVKFIVWWCEMGQLLIVSS